MCNPISFSSASNIKLKTQPLRWPHSVTATSALITLVLAWAEVLSEEKFLSFFSSGSFCLQSTRWTAGEEIKFWQTLSAGTLIEMKPNAFDEMQSEMTQCVGLRRNTSSPCWPSHSGWPDSAGQGNCGQGWRAWEGFPGLRDDKPSDVFPWSHWNLSQNESSFYKDDPVLI